MSAANHSTRVFVRPTGLHSPAMVRVSNALEKYLPASGYSIAGSPSPNYCDLQILHVIGPDAIEYARELRARGQRYAVIQYCLRTAGYSADTAADWIDMWQRAEVVWSYYDLSKSFLGCTFNFYHAPLGIDDAFIRGSVPVTKKDRAVITTGYVSGPGAEAIEAVWIAARASGFSTIHIGPEKVTGTVIVHRADEHYESITDTALASFYARASFVAALRHVEGFEMPAIEALSCGTRPIVFDQPDMRTWYESDVVYIRDSDGGDLIPDLTDVMGGLSSRGAALCHKVTAEEVGCVRDRFNWRRIVSGFWSALQEGAA